MAKGNANSMKNQVKNNRDKNQPTSESLHSCDGCGAMIPLSQTYCGSC